MQKKDLYLLLYLAEKTQLHQACQTSTGQIADDLHISQQTISRKLQAFAAAGVIERTATPSGMGIQLTSRGKQILQQLYTNLSCFFGEKKSLHGSVKSGLGEGKFYMSQTGYKKQFQSILGFVPYEGTLNLVVDPSAVDLFLSQKYAHTIHSFATKNRTFGGLHCYPVLIAQKIIGALIIPERTLHKADTIELIAPVFLRDTLQLENGTNVIVT